MKCSFAAVACLLFVWTDSVPSREVGARRSGSRPSNYKRVALIRGSGCSSELLGLLRCLLRIKEGWVVNELRNNHRHFRAFKAPEELEMLCRRKRCGLFVLGYGHRKHPNNLIFGRMHDGHLLDMLEFGTTQIQGWVKGVIKSSPGQAPLLLFHGNFSSEYRMRVRSVLTDLLSVGTASVVDKAGIQSAWSVVLVEQPHLGVQADLSFSLQLQYFKVWRPQSGSPFCAPNLQLQGPCFWLFPRRFMTAHGQLWETAQPSQQKQRVETFVNSPRRSLPGVVTMTHPKQEAKAHALKDALT